MVLCFLSLLNVFRLHGIHFRLQVVHIGFFTLTALTQTIDTAADASIKANLLFHNLLFVRDGGTGTTVTSCSIVFLVY